MRNNEGEKDHYSVQLGTILGTYYLTYFSQKLYKRVIILATLHMRD